MKRFSRFLVVTVFWALAVHAADSADKSIHGNISKLDSSTKTVVVKLKGDGERSLHFAGNTIVRGVDTSSAGSNEAFKGLSEGSEVVVHYWDNDGQNTTIEIDKVGKGKDGLKYVDGKVTKVGKDGKTVAVKAADGTEHAFVMSGVDTAEAAKKLGKDIGKSATVTVYYTEDSGKEVAHFFEKL